MTRRQLPNASSPRSTTRSMRSQRKWPNIEIVLGHRRIAITAQQVNRLWETFTYPQEAAATKHYLNASVTASWSSQPIVADRQWGKCDRDQYPPAYFLSDIDAAYINIRLKNQRAVGALCTGRT
ncbi:hypothetical protein M441DRAFT_63123 [Trichoderma asperellum CBS 433.97]|uniref:Uncharacterized protein n=2 Tax=Trichoderma asperellum TaxID=101201 RepID=A0A2T3YQW5_TRIA4|nr:hypothetical protein M441DRAFT_63123 [Trichoderma asperellum CBS 433.97]PTB34914.1 hypothetical protein M441DRAFT_63123 [Trichoderma asperellum CBS 433.97]